jgi:hypothetical protein
MATLMTVRRKRIGQLYGGYVYLAALVTTISIGIAIEALLSGKMISIGIGALAACVLAWTPVVLALCARVEVSEEGPLSGRGRCRRAFRWNEIAEIRLEGKRKIVVRDVRGCKMILTSGVLEQFDVLLDLFEYLAAQESRTRGESVRRLLNIENDPGSNLAQWLSRELLRIRGEICPECRRRDRTLADYRLMQVTSVVIATEWKNIDFRGCPSCLRWLALEKIGLTLLTGWWGIPNGILRTPMALMVDVSAIIASFAEDD